MFRIVVFFNPPMVIVGFHFTFATLHTSGGFLWHHGSIRVELRVVRERPVIAE